MIWKSNTDASAVQLHPATAAETSPVIPRASSSTPCVVTSSRSHHGERAP